MTPYDPAYSRGWTAASEGAGAHENPYPEAAPVSLNDDGRLKLTNPAQLTLAMQGAYSEIIPGQPKYMLWLSGYADYMASPFNCEALYAYNQIKRNGVPLDCDDMWNSENQDGSLVAYYDDGSKIEFTNSAKPLVRAYNVNDKCFAQLEI